MLRSETGSGVEEPGLSPLFSKKQRNRRCRHDELDRCGLLLLRLNRMLRVATGFRGTDTHGLKAFRRERLLDTVGRCVVDKDLFASEFVIRAGRDGKRVVEIPLRVAEKRKPSINLFKRVPNVLKNMAKLTWVIRVRHR